MTVDQALELSASLLTAANQAIKAGSSTVDLTAVLQSADDAARAELQAAIDAATD